MNEEKKLTNDEKEERVVEKQSSQGDYSRSELNDELEKLAQTFRDELKKAQEMSDEEFEEAYADELGIIPDEQLCECCGERRKDMSRGEKYQYCSVCRENMKSYPISIFNVITVLVLFVVAVVSVHTFSQNFYGYNLLYKAQKAESSKKLNTALMYYDAAISEFEKSEITAKNAYFESAEIIFKTMDNGADSMNEVASRVVSGLTEFETKLPIYSAALDLREECVVLYGTMQEFYNVINNEKYADYTPENEEMYEQIMTETGSLIDKEIAVVSADGATTQMMPTSEALIRFCQYMFAYASEKYDDSYQYMLQAQELAPDYYWLYAYELGMAELQLGNASEAKGLAKKLISQNVENADAYSLYTSAERVSGNFTNALNWANKGLEYNETNAELMRYKAMALCANGDLEEAQEVINKAIDSQEYALVYFTAIVIENELGNDDTVESYKELLEEEGVELSDRMNKYLSGKMTAVELFTEGTGEVQ